MYVLVHLDMILLKELAFFAHQYYFIGSGSANIFTYLTFHVIWMQKGEVLFDRGYLIIKLASSLSYQYNTFSLFDSYIFIGS